MTERPSVYIADLKVRMTPKSPKSKLHPVIIEMQQYPIVMYDDGSVDEDSVVSAVKRYLKGRVNDFSKYVLKYDISNVKYSTKCNWTKKK